MSDDTVYNGEFKNDVFHGKGKLKRDTKNPHSKENPIFEGLFEDGH